MIFDRRCWTLSILGLALTLQSSWADAARDERVRADLNYLVETVLARHPNPFTRISRGDFDARVAQLSISIPTLSDVQAYVRINSIAAAIGDAHTVVSLTGAYGAIGVQLFPMRFTLYDDGFFVSQTAEPHRAYLGHRLVSINGSNSAELIPAIRPYVSFDNEQNALQQTGQMMVSPQLLHAMGIGQDPDAAVVVLADGLGRSLSLNLRGTNTAMTEFVNDPSVRYLSPTYSDLSLNYWYRYYPEQRLLFFKYNRCAQRADLPFADFAADLFRTLDSQPVDRLVVDLRDNGGGNSSGWNPFLTGLRSRYANLRQRNATFGLYGLISRFTFSSGMFAAQEFKGFAGARLVGEATGGNPESFGETLMFSLPNLPGSLFWVSTRFFRPFVPGVAPPAVQPDIRVRRFSSDVFARFDPILFTVFAASGRHVPGPSMDSSGDVFSAAHYNPGAAQSPGALSTLFGDFGQGVVPTIAGTLPLPRQLAGVEVTIGGRPAPLLLVSPGQINLQQPNGNAPLQETVIVSSNGTTLWTGRQTTVATAPSLFTSDPENFRRPGAILNQDGSLNSRQRPARRGESILVFATAILSSTRQLSRARYLPPARWRAHKPPHVFSSASGTWPFNLAGPVLSFRACGRSTRRFQMWLSLLASCRFPS
jgi:uncharacterized protein (TIGR03437 family)